MNFISLDISSLFKFSAGTISARINIDFSGRPISFYQRNEQMIVLGWIKEDRCFVEIMRHKETLRVNLKR